MSNILIENPKVNPELKKLRQWSNIPQTKKDILEHLSDWEVKPTTHKKAVDICAGDGTVAALLLEAGWRPEYVLCVDQYQSPTPLVPDDIRWEFLDIQALYNALQSDSELPNTVKQHHGQYDLAIALFGDNLIPSAIEVERVICGFFAKESSHIFIY